MRLKKSFVKLILSTNNSCLGEFKDFYLYKGINDLDKVKLTGGSVEKLSEKEKKHLSGIDVELSFFDDFGAEFISLYGVAKSIRIIDAKPDFSDVLIEGYDLFQFSDGAKDILDERMEMYPSLSGRWVDLDISEKQSWLEICLLDKRRPSSILEKNIYFISGSEIKCIDDFFCAVGEAFCGPGGYMGRNLTSMEECFESKFFDKHSIVLIWRNFESSSRFIGQEKIHDLLTDVSSILKKNGVTLNLD